MVARGSIITSNDHWSDHGHSDVDGLGRQTILYMKLCGSNNIIFS